LFSVFPLIIKDNLVFIFWLTFLAFSILSLQRIYIHLNSISFIQLIFVSIHFIFFSFNSKKKQKHFLLL